MIMNNGSIVGWHGVTGSKNNALHGVDGHSGMKCEEKILWLYIALHN